MSKRMRTLKFKKEVCDNCVLADRRTLHAGNPFCSNHITTGRYPIMKNGECLGFIKRSKKSRE